MQVRHWTNPILDMKAKWTSIVNVTRGSNAREELVHHASEAMGAETKQAHCEDLTSRSLGCFGEAAKITQSQILALELPTAVARFARNQLRGFSADEAFQVRLLLSID